MASWAIHFRIADSILDKFNTLDKNYFIIGNIAPDCGVPVEGGYAPPSEITHRTGGGNYKGNCNYHSIYEDFIKYETDVKAKSFWLGYFVHYVTDCLWVKTVYDVLDKQYGPLTLGTDINNAIRREWYNLDFTYFNENTSPSFEIFKRINGFDESYPTFYEKGDISKRMEFIKQFYKNKPAPMEYKYTTMKDVNSFVLYATDIIFNKLKERNITL